MLTNLHAELEAAGIRLRMAGAHASVRDMLRAEGLEERVGYFGRRVTAADSSTNSKAPPEPGGKRRRKAVLDRRSLSRKEFGSYG